MSVGSAGAARSLGTATAAFTAGFAVWTLFSIIGLQFRDAWQLSETRFALLIALPILTGSLARPLLGIWADRRGGRGVLTLALLAAALATVAVSFSNSYSQVLLAGLFVGLAGAAFPAGVAHVARFFPAAQQGPALGIFGAGNVGAALTHLCAPLALAAMGWRPVALIWAGLLAVAAAIFLVASRAAPPQPSAERRSLRAELALLNNPWLWRYAIYYALFFGTFVALALWLPHYLMVAYGLDLVGAGLLAALFSAPAALFRPYGGRLAERHGTRAVVFWALAITLLCTFLLAYPPTTYTITGLRGAIQFHTEMALLPFAFVIAVLGFFVALGKAAVFKHLPAFYPHQTGAAAGAVGLVGGVGGFVMTLCFGVLLDVTGIWTSAFALLFLVSAVALGWMAVAVRYLERRTLRAAELAPELPEMDGLGEPGIERPRRRPGPIVDWRPEDEEFWARTGRRIARRNLWISTYCLLLAFAVWMVWSVVVARMPAVGFDFSADQLFWLAAAPGLSGATLRIFYAFLVPIFGGRLWTTISTGLLLIPAFGIGYAVQNPDTPYLIFLVLALLCGFGGGSFASSVANIGYFFPKREKGNALALNSGLGNVGVSVMQLVVPVAITMSLFGALGGEAQVASDGTRLWMQNAGFLWVPFIVAGALAAWLGMDDIASAKSSFADQATIFGRRDTWLMSWLYTGTFGTFIGMSAGFPLLCALVFPEVKALRYAFIGPLIGALSRAGSGWIADRLGGARVSLWSFALMVIAVFGMIWFLEQGSFGGFFAMVLALFVVSGVGNASVFQMVPGIMRRVLLGDRQPEPAKLAQVERESAAITGFISAIAAFGAFYIPKAYGTSIAATGSPNGALWAFLIFYLSCVVLTWWFYSGPRGLLRDEVARRAHAVPARAVREGSRQ